MIKTMVLAAVAAAALAAPAAASAQDYFRGPPPPPEHGWGFHGWERPHFGWGPIALRGPYEPYRPYRRECFREVRYSYWGRPEVVTFCR